TVHFVIGGWLYAYWVGGSSVLVWSIAGSAVGLASLLPLYAIGGMGGGDVKLMARVGAWVWAALVFWSVVSTVLVGGLIGLVMMAWSGRLKSHLGMMQMIGCEILTVRDPRALSVLAAERKPSMLLLPYGIPIAVGTIAYLAWAGFLG